MTPKAQSNPTGLRARPSLWLHGAGLNGETWRRMIDDLPRAVAPDLPSHRDDEPPATSRVEADAEALLPLLEEGMVVIGHSLGGMVALELAARSPMPLAALVLVEAVPTVRDRWLGRVASRLARPLLKHLPPRRLAWLASLGQSPETRAEIQRTIAQRSGRQIVGAFDAARLYDGRQRLEAVSVPTLILVSRDSQATHRGARLAADRIDGASMQSLSGGHLLHIDNPEGLRRAIDAFLCSLPPREGAPGRGDAGRTSNDRTDA
ncbi:MAG: alpha/beta hydrolase [Pseudomonadota bacterium]